MQIKKQTLPANLCAISLFRTINVNGNKKSIAVSRDFTI